MKTSSLFNLIANLQIHGTTMSQIPLLVSQPPQRIALRALQRFTFEESRHRPLRDEPELRSLHPVSDHELNILDMLKEHASLKSIELLSRDPSLRPFKLDWNDLSESIRSSLIFLIQLPTITHLDINDFKEFPETVLSGCSNLIDLQLGEIKLAPPEVNQVISRTKIPTPVSLYIKRKAHGLTALLNSANLHSGDPIVDFSRLKKAQFHLESRESFVLVNGLIKVITRLEHLKIGGKWTDVVVTYLSKFWHEIISSV